MTTGGSIEGVGDNKEFTVADISTVTIYFNDSNTSADDTATNRYFDNGSLAKAFTIRPNQTIQILSINGQTFTDPISVFINTVYTEKFDTPTIFKMEILTTVANTHIRLRFRGR